MKNKICLTYKFIILGGVMSAVASSAFAASDFSLIGGVGLEGHDNAGLTQSDEQSDTKQIVSADVGYKKTDGAVNADIDYQAQYGNYVHDVQSDQTAINGKAELTWQVAPRELDVVLSHQITQDLTDRRGLDVASNREERSVLTAGVDGFLHFSPVDSLVLAPRFSEVRFQESDSSDSKNASMGATLEHRINAASALDLVANYDDVKFDDSANNYNEPSLMLSFHTELSHLKYQIGFGANQINRDQGDDLSAPRALVTVDYHDNNGQDWGMSYLRELTDTSIGLSGYELQLTNFQANDSNFAQIDYIEEDKFDAYWRNHFSATSQLGLSAGYQKENYKVTPQDQSIAYVQMNYEYFINSRWSAGLDGRFDRTKFLDDPTQQYDTRHLYVSAIYHPAKPMEVRFSVGQDKRSTDTSTGSYTDNVVLMGLRYTFF